MAIKRVPSGWLVDIKPGGRSGRRVRRTFDTKPEALRFETFVKGQYAAGAAWNPPPADSRRLSELCRLWYSVHGSSLKDGLGRLEILKAMSLRVGDPVASRFTAALFSVYRQQRLEAGISPNTVNHEHAYLRAVFNELSRLGEWSLPNPLTSIRRLRYQETELTYLNDDQISRLLAELRRGRNADAYPVAVICLATGARWSEAVGLRRRNFREGLVVFEDTKSGKRRGVPVDASLAALVLDGRGAGALFRPCYSAFRVAVDRAGIELPAGQLSHVLRHTFASHFLRNGGNIRALQIILGHSSLTVTMRYAHLMPGHLEDVLRFNPLRCGLFVDNAPDAVAPVLCN